MNVLFVNNGLSACGVHEYGDAVFDILAADVPTGVNLVLADCPTQDSYCRAYALNQPDVVIWNYQWTTFPWVSDWLSDLTPAWHVGIAHDGRMADPMSVNYNAFNRVISQDPTCPSIIGRLSSLVRPIRPMPERPPWTGRPTVGSFGFVYGRKRFDTLTELVCRQYDDCLIRLHLPTGSLNAGVSERNALHMAERCRRIVRESGKKIDIEITHDYMSRSELVEWLANNSINALWYDEDDGSREGVSSCPDAMLECGRPMAVNKNQMFRHLFSRNIHMEDRPLPEIERDGMALIRAFRNTWTPEAVRKIVWEAATRQAPTLYPLTPTGSNRVLGSTGEWEAAKHSLALAALHIPACPIKSWDARIVLDEIGDGDLLDMGCQSSVILPNAQRAGIRGKKFGVDFTPGQFNPGIVPIVGDITRTQFPDASFDYITCLSTVEHEVDIAAFAKEAGRLLRPNGKLIVSFDYWPNGLDTSSVSGWSVFGRADTERLIEALATNGLHLTSEMDWSCPNEVVTPPWSPIPAGYTFAILTCRKQ